MAGSNKILKEGQVLFKAGDKADGMYLIRRGELRVYLEQNGKEVTLVTIGAGGMIGEMALFDNSPRSASVKATVESEVTLISLDDFGKLMKQIPKWFVGLMSALSSRLRSTNERLQKLEAGMPAKGRPYAATIRILNIFNLLLAKDGVKEGKDTIIQKAPVEKSLIETFGEDDAKVKALFEILVKHKVLGTKVDSYKNAVFVAVNRQLLLALPSIIANFLKHSEGKTCLPDSALAMLRCLERQAEASPYDSITASLADLEKEAIRDGLVTASWKDDINLFKAGFDEVKLVKVSNGVGLKTGKKEIGPFVRAHELLVLMTKANLT